MVEVEVGERSRRRRMGLMMNENGKVVVDTAMNSWMVLVDKLGPTRFLVLDL